MMQSENAKVFIGGFVLAVTALVLAACGGSVAPAQTSEPPVGSVPEAEPPAPTATPDAAVEPNESAQVGNESIDWRACGRVQCGAVTVPIDYNDASLGQIDVAVTMRRATDLDGRIGYLFVNPGGPGLAAGPLVAAAERGYQPELLEVFDIVGVDPRGSGGTPPEFSCGVGTEQQDLLAWIEGDADTPEEIKTGNRAAQLCVDSMGPLAARMGMHDVARDMDAVRHALGADRISYLSGSYGSNLGVWYASLFPERVRAMVIDSAINPLGTTLDGFRRPRNVPDDLETALALARDTLGPYNERFTAALNACDRASCPIWNNGDPMGLWYEAAAGMADAQIVATSWMNGTTLMLYDESRWPDLHQAIDRLHKLDDMRGFLAPLDGLNVDKPEHIYCLDRWALFPGQTVAEIVENNQRFDEQVQPVLAADYPLLFAADLSAPAPVCPHYDAIGVPPFEGELNGAGVPILVIGNTLDPGTPFVQTAQLAHEVLSDGRLVQVAHPGHVVHWGGENPCVNELVRAALVDLEYPERRTAGAAEQCPATVR